MAVYDIVTYWRDQMVNALDNRPIEDRPPFLPVALQRDAERFLDWQTNGCCLPHDVSVGLKNVYHQTAKEPADLAQHTLSVGRYDLAIAYSGGMDSSIAAVYADLALQHNHQSVVLVHTNYGAPYAAKELRVSRALYDKVLWNHANVFKHVDLKVPTIDESRMGKGYIVPLRNAVLAATAAYFSSNVWIVGNYRPDDAAEGAAIDKGRRFYGEMSALLSQQYKRPVIVSSPFLHWTKADSVRWLLERLGVDKATSLLELTTSCYDADAHRCGLCSSCAKLALMCEELGLVLPSLDVGLVERQPRFQEYVRRERTKGRSVPSRWSHL